MSMFFVFCVFFKEWSMSSLSPVAQLGCPVGLSGAMRLKWHFSNISDLGRTAQSTQNLKHLTKQSQSQIAGPLSHSDHYNFEAHVLWKYLSATLTFPVHGAEMTKHHGWCHTGCQPGPHSWWPDTAWQVQSRLPDKASKTSCPMSCCQSDYIVFMCHELVANPEYKKINLFARLGMKMN